MVIASTIASAAMGVDIVSSRASPSGEATSC